MGSGPEWPPPRAVRRVRRREQLAIAERRLANRKASHGLEAALDLLDLLHDDGADAGHVRRLHLGDDVVLAGDGVRQGDPADALKRLRHLYGLPRRRVDEHIRSHGTLLDEFRPSEYGFDRR